MVELIFPAVAKDRGVRYWARPGNLWASRRKLHADYSNEWRYALEADTPPPVARSVSFASLLGGGVVPQRFRFIVIGDTGEGDRSQYGLLPLIRAASPGFMIINGDVAYPAGEHDDFVAGFFEPYRNLGIPIWAVPGNHEYYSAHHGREFYDIFCTRKYAALWAAYGLRSVPQPSVYWELRTPAGEAPLVVIGVDSGKKANLDGHTGLITRLNPFAHSQHPDHQQHQWLEWRLSLADQRGDKVVVLFHIPALVKQEHKDETHLGELHRIMARHPSVRLVVTAHEHNHQQYAPPTFQGYSGQKHGATPGAHAPPHYIVSGNGGATVDTTDFKSSDYPVLDRFPSVGDWQAHSWRAQRLLAAMGQDKSLAGQLIGHVKDSVAADDDAAGLLSFLLFEVDAGAVHVSLIALDDLQQLFSRQPDGTRVYVTEPRAPLDPDALDRCRRRLFDL